MHREIAESIVTGRYAPQTERRVEIQASPAALAMRERARIYRASAPAESADLDAAADLLAADGRRFTIDYIDAARLLGPVGAKRLPRKE
jgi:hypothetical protein